MTSISSLDQNESTSKEEFSLYGTTVSSIIQIPELGQINNSQSLTLIRIMHSLNLKSMQVILFSYKVRIMLT